MIFPHMRPRCTFTFAQQFVFTPPTFILHHLLVKSILINCKTCFHFSFFVFRHLLSHNFPLTYIDEISPKMFHNFPLSSLKFLVKFLHLYTIDGKLDKKFHDSGRILKKVFSSLTAIERRPLYFERLFGFLLQKQELVKRTTLHGNTA